MGRVAGLDVGTKTIGVAISDPAGKLASPLFTLSRRGVRRDVERLLAMLAEEDVGRFVVGMPLELDGSETRSARLARQVGDAVRDSAGVPVIYIDERYSSVEAERQLIASGVSRQRRKEIIDQAAAVVILQSYLDHGDWSGIDAEGPTTAS